MNRTLIQHLEVGRPCLIQGFVSHIRHTRAMVFIVIRDRTGSVQVSIEEAARPDLTADMAQLTVESTVSVAGVVVPNPHVKLDAREVLPEAITIHAIAQALPLLPDSSIDTRLDYRWLDLRAPRQLLVFQVQTLMVEAFRQCLRKQDFMEIHTPKLIGAASESGADVFELTYFDRKAYLSQSPQFYKQMAMAAGFERIFEIGPVFRAEKSHTRKHATEFTGFDIEMSWISSYRDIMTLEAEMLTYALGQIKAAYGPNISRLCQAEVTVPTLPFPVIRLEELYQELEKRYGLVVAHGDRGDLTTEAEQLSYRFSQEVFGHEFLFVTDFAAENRAFYHMREAGIPQGYDLLWRGVEITTGAQREHRYEKLIQQAADKGLGEDVAFYTAFFRYGCPPHGGFGLGIDRMTMLLMDLSIKEAMFLFRGPNRLTP